MSADFDCRNCGHSSESHATFTGCMKCRCPGYVAMRLEDDEDGSDGSEPACGEPVKTAAPKQTSIIQRKLEGIVRYAQRSCIGEPIILPDGSDGGRRVHASELVKNRGAFEDLIPVMQAAIIGGFGALAQGDDVIAVGVAGSGCPFAEALDPVALAVTKDGKLVRFGKDMTYAGKVLLVEDIISTGGSVLRAACALESKGCEVVGVLSLFNRCMPGVLNGPLMFCGGYINMCDYHVVSLMAVRGTEVTIHDSMTEALRHTALLADAAVQSVE